MSLLREFKIVKYTEKSVNFFPQNENSIKIEIEANIDWIDALL